MRASSFHDKGYVLVTELLPREMVAETVEILDRLAGKRRGLGGWTAPDGVTQVSSLWPIIFNRRLLEEVRRLIGPNIRFLQHNDLHIGFSSYNWHRDSVSRKFGEGSDWDPSEPYRIVRVGIYLQPRNASSFQLGFLPGTHRLPSVPQAADREDLEGMTGNLSLLRRMISGRNPSPAGAEWLTPAAGDAVIFDPRVIHTGSRTDGPKYSVFVAYGEPNNHYFDHAVYYRFLRSDLGYQRMQPALVAQLQAAGLYQAVQSAGREVRGATIPGFIHSFIGGRIRHKMRTAD
jgi:hypothetical protein